jgi:hypothetical protein
MHRRITVVKAAPGDAIEYVALFWMQQEGYEFKPGSFKQPGVVSRVVPKRYNQSGLLHNSCRTPDVIVTGPVTFIWCSLLNIISFCAALKGRYLLPVPAYIQLLTTW